MLNLLFSVQAAYTGPVLLLAGNRQAQRDRAMAEHDFAINQTAEAEIRQILEHLVRNTEATLCIARHVGAVVDEVQGDSQSTHMAH